MASQYPSCSACGWATWRQERCEYASHVKLFRGYEDRGIWTIGNDYILKERPKTLYDNPNSETICLKFLQDNSTIPVPTIIKDWVDNGRYFKLQERIKGETLEDVWPTLTIPERTQIADETAQYLVQLRKFQSPRIESFGGQPIPSNYLFSSKSERFHGPFDSDDALYNDLIHDSNLSDLSGLREHVPRCAPYTLTNGDLNISNIIVRSGHVAAIIDWETAGYLPIWWEWVRAGIGHGKDDTVWKGMLRERMEQFPKEEESWKDLNAQLALLREGGSYR